MKIKFRFRSIISKEITQASSNLIADMNVYDLPKFPAQVHDSVSFGQVRDVVNMYGMEISCLKSSSDWPVLAAREVILLRDHKQVRFRVGVLRHFH
jgi:hypothetical protein